MSASGPESVKAEATNHAMPDGAPALKDLAAAVLEMAKHNHTTIVSAESCTGGLLSSLITDIEGCSGLFERGFVTYSEESKAELLGVAPIMIARHGVVSREVAIAMAQGALANSRAGLAISITGFAGPGERRDEEGLVHLAACDRDGALIHRESHFGPSGRDAVRLLAAQGALEMLAEILRGEGKPH